MRGFIRNERDEALAPIEEPDTWLGPDSDFTDRRQTAMPCIENKERLTGFTEVELGYPEAIAVEEAKRCLRCELRLRLSPPISPPIKVKSV